MSRPIVVRCRRVLPATADEVADGILDLSQWPSFVGYGPLPGVASAEFEVRTPEVVGSRIRVQNRDGSTHVEEIVEWDPPRRLALRMAGFAPPLSRLATHFVETWEFAPGGRVTRSVALHPRSWWTWPLVWLIGLLMRRALVRHLDTLAEM